MATTVVVGDAVVVGATVVVGAKLVVVGGTVDGAGVTTVLVDAVGATDSEVVAGAVDCGVDDVAASTRALSASTIDGDGVGGMTTGSDAGAAAVGSAEPATGGI